MKNISTAKIIAKTWLLLQGGYSTFNEKLNNNKISLIDKINQKGILMLLYTELHDSILDTGLIVLIFSGSILIGILVTSSLSLLSWSVTKELNDVDSSVGSLLTSSVLFTSSSNYNYTSIHILWYIYIYIYI